MKKIISFISISMLTIFLFTSIASAGYVNDRKNKQKQLILQGIKNGELNAQEAHVLKKEQQRIWWYQQNALSDGKIDAQECLQLEQKLDRASKHIYKLRHNKINRQLN